MTQQITNLDEAMESIQVIEAILNERPNIRWLVEWQSPEGLVTSLRRVTKNCEEVVTRLKQLLVWAMTRTDAGEQPVIVNPFVEDDYQRWAELTEGVSVPF